MTPEQIKAMQRRIGVTDDGFWGPRSIAACRTHLRDTMPSPHPWPSRARVADFYGRAGDEGNLTTITFPYAMFYGGKRVERTRCHYKVADSLLRVLTAIRDLMPTAPHIADEASDYGGIYNYRNKRGSSSLSMHAWGIAIDLDADDNMFRDSWPMRADMPLEIMECFAVEGWTSAGAFWGYDAMHFEAVQP